MRVLEARRSRVKDVPCADLFGDDCHAIALLRQTRRAHRDQIAGALSDDRFRRAVWPFEMMNIADGLPVLHFGAEVEANFKNARLRSEQIVFAVESLGQNDRRLSETRAGLLTAFENASVDDYIAQAALRDA